ncbi:MAG: NAD-binding protein [Fibrobacter sp.]|nr:NAD-binding protein [Fibrobacter sp.]
MKVALLGVTGLVGGSVARLLSRLENVDEVWCPVRSQVNYAYLGLVENFRKFNLDVIDFASIGQIPKSEDVAKVEAGLCGADAVICCLGTTRKKAGSRVIQERVDVGLPLVFAAIAKRLGVRHFLCVSAQGADAHSPFFYNRLKGILEDGLTMMNFEALTLVRPSLLLGERKERRWGEDLMKKIFGAHPEMVPQFFRPIPAETVAAHLVASLLKPPFDHVCASDGVKGKRIIYNRVLAKTRVDELF